jgi:hypothetical protein
MILASSNAGAILFTASGALRQSEMQWMVIA